MVKGRKGFTLLELVVAIAVIGIATSLTVVFCISTTNSVKKEKEQSNAVYAVKDAHDFLFNWVSAFDTTEYSLHSVTEDMIIFKSLLDDEEFSAYYSDGMLNTEYREANYAYDIKEVKGMTFALKDNLIKVTVEIPDGSTSFVISKKTN